MRLFSWQQAGLILGIETSFDDTALALLTSEGNSIASWSVNHLKEHKKFGGINPLVARKRHEKELKELWKMIKNFKVQDVKENAHRFVVVRTDEETQQLLQHEEAEVFSDFSEDSIANLIKIVAVTNTPGLLVSLQQGMEFAQRLSTNLKIPMLPIHHMEAHFLIARRSNPELIFPFLSLIVSGGHTLLVFAKSLGDYMILGQTRDDAVGEAYDKAARALKLEKTDEEAGGAAIERYAKHGNHSTFPLPIPMKLSKDLDFSFSGLKTSLICTVNKLESVAPLTIQQQFDLAASFQHSCVEHIGSKTKSAVEQVKSYDSKCTSLVLAGGVASNQSIRARIIKIANDSRWSFYCPPPILCSDNGEMIAWTALEYIRKSSIKKLLQAGFDCAPSTPLGPKLKISLPRKLKTNILFGKVSKKIEWPQIKPF